MYGLLTKGCWVRIRRRTSKPSILGMLNCLARMVRLDWGFCFLVAVGGRTRGKRSVDRRTYVEKENVRPAAVWIGKIGEGFDAVCDASQGVVARAHDLSLQQLVKDFDVYFAGSYR